MYGILLSAFFSVLRWLVTSVLVKFAVFFGLYFVTTGFMSVITSLLPNASALSSGLGGITENMWYFLDYFGVSQGLPMIIAAYVTRFTIRRLPVIG